MLRSRVTCLKQSVKARVRLEYWISFCRVATSARLRGNSPLALQRSTWKTSEFRRPLRHRDSLKRPIRNQPAIPIILALDLDCREAGRQCAARHHVLRLNHMMMWTASPQRHHSAKAWSQERHKEGDRP